MIKWIFKYFAPKKNVHAKLEPCFTDSKGVKYYRFSENASLPIERFGKLQEYMMYMSAGVTASELDALLEEADKALTEGLTQKKNAAKIGFIISQIRERKNMVLHTELLYNFLAVQVIREDEQPEHFSNRIQMEKVERFKEETAKGNTYDFFFAIGLKKLNDLYKMSEPEWTQYWEESLQRQAKLQKVLKLLRSEEKSSTTSSEKATTL